MNLSPLHELLQSCLNGTLDEAQEQELARLLRESGEAREALRSSLRLEGGLISLARAGQLNCDTAQHVEGQRVAAAPVLPCPVKPSSPRSKLASWRLPVRRVLIGAAVLAASVLILLAGIRWLTPGPDHIPTPAPLAHVLEMEGTVEIVSVSGEIRPAQVREPLRAGESLQTGDSNSLAVIELADARRLELSPGTTIRLPEDETGSVQLIQGVVRGTESEHMERPLVVTTAGLRVRVEGDRFALSSASPESLRVDIEAGKAEVTRQRDQKSLTVEPGAPVLVQADADDMVVGSTPRLVSEPKRVLGHPGAWAIFFEPDGQHLLAASYREVHRFGPGPKSERVPLSTDTSQGRFAAFSRDGSKLAVYRGLHKDDPVILWDLRTKEQQTRIDVRVTDQKFALSPDASWLAAADKEGTSVLVHLWDAQTGKKRFSLSPGPRVNCLAASPDGSLLAAGVVNLGKREPNRIVLVNTQTGKEHGVLPTRAYPLTVMAFSPDGNYLAAGITGQVQIWNIEKRELVRTIRGFERVLYALAWAPNGNLLAGGMQDGQVWVWDTRRGEEVQVIRAGTSGVRVLAFAPDGRSIVTGGIKKQPLMIWEPTPPPGAHPERRGKQNT